MSDWNPFIKFASHRSLRPRDETVMSSRMTTSMTAIVSRMSLYPARSDYDRAERPGCYETLKCCLGAVYSALTFATFLVSAGTWCDSEGLNGMEHGPFWNQTGRLHEVISRLREHSTTILAIIDPRKGDSLQGMGKDLSSSLSFTSVSFRHHDSL